VRGIFKMLLTWSFSLQCPLFFTVRPELPILSIDRSVRCEPMPDHLNGVNTMSLLKSDGTRIIKLLTFDSNTKLIKSAEKISRVKIGSLSLAQGDLSGHEVCAHRTAGCTGICVGSCGLSSVFTSIMEARIQKTRLFFSDRRGFLDQLHHELRLFARRCKRSGQSPVMRLNCFSDLPWESIAPRLFDHAITYYDYTKGLKRYRRFLSGRFPSNYHLTYSRSERTPDELIRSLINRGGNVAVVLPLKKTSTYPQQYRGMPAVSGDEHDLRYLDPPGRIVILRAKGGIGKDTTGFVDRRPDTGFTPLTISA
jgi:hypothetical protein